MSDGGDVVSERRVGVFYLSPNAPFVLCPWNRAEALELPPVPRLPRLVLIKLGDANT